MNRVDWKTLLPNPPKKLGDAPKPLAISFPIDWKQEWQLELAILREYQARCVTPGQRERMRSMLGAVPRNESEWLALGQRFVDLQWEIRHPETVLMTEEQVDDLVRRLTPVTGKRPGRQPMESAA